MSTKPIFTKFFGKKAPAKPKETTASSSRNTATENFAAEALTSSRANLSLPFTGSTSTLHKVEDEPVVVVDLSTFDPATANDSELRAAFTALKELTDFFNDNPNIEQKHSPLGPNAASDERMTAKRTKELLDAEMELVETRKELRNLKNEMKEMRIAYEDNAEALNHSLKHVTEDCANWKKKFKELDQEIKNLKGQQSESVNEMEKTLREALSNRTEEVKRLQQGIVAANERANEESLQWATQSEEMEKEMHNLRNALELATKKEKENQKKLEETRVKFENERQEVIKMSLEMQKLSEVNREYKVESEQLSTNHLLLKGKELTETVAQSELEAIQRKLEDLEIQFETERDSWEREREELLQVIEEAQNPSVPVIGSETIDHTAEATMRQNKDAARIADLLEELESVKRDRDRAEEQLDKLDETESKYKKEIHSLQSTLEETRIQLKKALKNVSDVDFKIKCEELEYKISENEIEIQSLQLSKGIMEDEKDILVREFKTLEEENGALHTEIDSLRKEMEELTTSVSFEDAKSKENDWDMQVLSSPLVENDNCKLDRLSSPVDSAELKDLREKVIILENEKKMLVERMVLMNKRETSAASPSKMSEAKVRRTYSSQSKQRVSRGSAISAGATPENQFKIFTASESSITPATPQRCLSVASSFATQNRPATAASTVDMVSPVDQLIRFKQRAEIILKEISENTLAKGTIGNDDHETLLKEIRDLYIRLDERDNIIEDLQSHLETILNEEEAELGETGQDKKRAARLSDGDIYMPKIGEKEPIESTVGDTLHARIRRKILDLEHQNDMLQIRVQRLQRQKEDADQDLADREEELASLRGQLNSFMDRSRSQPSDLNVSKIVLNEIEDQNDSLLGNSAEELSRLEQDVRLLRMERDAISEEVEEKYFSCAKKMRKEINRRDNLVAQLRNKLEELGHNDLPELDSDNEEIGARIEELETQSEHKEKLLRGLKNENRKLSEYLNETVEIMDAEGMNLQKEWIQILESPGVLESFRKNEAIQIDPSKEEQELHDVLAKERKHAQQKTDELCAQIDELQAGLEERNIEIEQLREMNSHLEAELENVEERSRELEAVAKVAESMQSVLREELVRKQKEVESMKVSPRKKSSQIASLTSDKE